jgi:hypothetical protein
LQDRLLNCVTNNGMGIDVGLGLLYHRGFISPMEIIHYLGRGERRWS